MTRKTRRAPPSAGIEPGQDYARAVGELDVLCRVYEDMMALRTQELAAAQAQVRLLRHALQQAQLAAAKGAEVAEAAREGQP